VPLCRHSPLPELLEFVKLFRPNSIVPNTLDVSLNGLDWLAINKVFEPCLALGHPAPPGPVFIPGEDWRTILRSVESDLTKGKHHLPEEDVDVKNSVDDEMAQIVARWSSGNLEGRKSRKVALLKEWLGISGVSVQKSAVASSSPVKPLESDEDSDSDAEDARGRTAHFLFAGSDCGRSSVSFDFENSQSQSQSLSQHQDADVVDEVVGCLPELAQRNRLTPSSSPFRVALETPEPDLASARRKYATQTAEVMAAEIAQNLSAKGKKRALGDSSSPMSSLYSGTPARPIRKADIFDDDFREDESSSPPAQRRRLDSGAPVRPIRASELLASLSGSQVSAQSQSRFQPRPLPEIKKMEGPPKVTRIRSEKLARRLELTHSLTLSNPDLVAPTYAAARKDLVNKYVRAKNAEDILEMKHKRWEALPVGESDDTPETERVLEIRKGILEDVKRERRIHIPDMECLQQTKLR
jgi:DNA cross-link repair 1C protein